MLIRSTTQKGKRASFQRAVQYLMKVPKREDAPVLPLQTWNLLSRPDDPVSVTKELQENYRAFARKRQKGVVLFHEFVSVHPADRERITPEELEQFVMEYLGRRAEKGIGCFRIEWEDNPHANIVLAGNEFQSAQQLRLSRKRFAEIQCEMEAWQRENLPQLRHSLVYINPQLSEQRRESQTVRQEKNQRRQREFERERRMASLSEGERKASNKERVREAMEQALREAASQEELVAMLGQRGITFSWRSARSRKTPRVHYQTDRQRKILKDGTILEQARVYRLGTLGLAEHFFEQQERWQDALKNRVALQMEKEQKPQRLQGKKM